MTNGTHSYINVYVLVLIGA